MLFRMESAETAVEMDLRAQLADSIDCVAIDRQRDWSIETFGPMDGHRRIDGIIDHLRHELGEVAATPHDITEWVDLIVLALDGAMRAGFQSHEIVRAYHAKMAKNMQRTWPDWRTVPDNQAIEHVRGSHD